MYGIDQNFVGNSTWPPIRSKFHSLSINDLVVRPDGIGLVTNEISFLELRFLEEQHDFSKFSKFLEKERKFLEMQYRKSNIFPGKTAIS